MTTTDPAARAIEEAQQRIAAKLARAPRVCPACGFPPPGGGERPKTHTTDRTILERVEMTAPRASEAVRGDGSPTPDVGAVRGREGGSAAESEPRGTAKRRILEALDRWHEVGADTTGEFAGVMEAVDDYAAAIEQRVRLQVLDEVDAYDAAEARAEAAEGRTEPRVHYEVEAPRTIDGVKRWQYVETYAELIDARSHVDGCPAPDRIVRVTREVIQ